MAVLRSTESRQKRRHRQRGRAESAWRGSARLCLYGVRWPIFCVVEPYDLSVTAEGEGLGRPLGAGAREEECKVVSYSVITVSVCVCNTSSGIVISLLPSAAHFVQQQ